MSHIIISFILILTLLFAYQNCSDTQSQSEQKPVQKLTLDLMSLIQKAFEGEQEDLIIKAKERKAMLLELMETDTEQALQVMIPDDKKQNLPQEIQEYLETKVSLKGELTTLYEDYSDGSHKLRHFLKDSKGKRYEVHSSKKDLDIQSGSQVSLSGYLLDNRVVTAECCDSTVSDPINLTYGNTFGEFKTIVFLVNFEDKPEEPYTVQEIKDKIFGDVSGIFMEASNNRTWLTGDVVGWYTIAQSSTACDYWGLASQAKEAARQSGVDIYDGYSRYMYIFPRNGCSWTGLGVMGGNPGTTWINGTSQSNVMGHELGHNFGLHHSKSKDCDTTPIDIYCTISNYGDFLDTMGNRNLGHFNAFQKIRLGWLENLQTVDSDGTYLLEPYETAPGANAKALRILKEVDSTTGEKTWYYLEYRQPIGYDSFVTNYETIQNGVVFHTGVDGQGTSSYLLDMTTGSARNYDINDPALTVGQTFTDPNIGLSVTPIQNDSNSMEVSISITNQPQPCVPGVPQISLAPSTGDWVEAGTSVSYSMNITNTDSSTCSSSTFNQSASVATGWSASFLNNSVTLTPGSSTTVNLSVTSPTTAVDGFYEIKVTTSNSTNSASGTVTYVVSNPVVNTAPIAVNDSATTDEGQSVTIDVLSNDSDADGDSLTITGTSGVNGTAVIISDGAITFTPASGFNGTESFNYAISDGNGGTASATVTVTVNATPDPVDSTPPTVKVTSPLDGQSVSGNSTISITATASDNVEVSKVDFYVDGTLLCTDLTASYACTYTVPKAKNKTYLIEARATDSSGNMASHQIQINTSSSTTGGGGKGGGGGGKGPNK